MRCTSVFISAGLDAARTRASGPGSRGGRSASGPTSSPSGVAGMKSWQSPFTTAMEASLGTIG